MPNVDSLNIQVSAEAQKADKELTNLITKLDKVQKTISKTNANGGVKFPVEATKETGKGLSNIEQTAKTALASFSKLYLGTKALKTVFKGLTKAIGSASDYLETFNYFSAAFSQVAENADLSQWENLGYSSAEEYYNSFQKRASELTTKMTGFNVSDTGNLTNSGMGSLGMNSADVMQYQAMFGQMSSSLGIASDTALNMSNALTMIGADLASIRNTDFKSTWNNLASGIASGGRALDKFGISLRESSLQQKLNELGIRSTTSALTQSEKAILRTIVILDSSKYAWGDLAKTINQPANQIRLLKSNFENLARTIGSIFMPIVVKVLPVINGLTIAIQRLFSWIGGLMGIDLSGLSSAVKSEDLGVSFDDATSGAQDLETSTGKTADNVKKIQKGLRAFDELKTISLPKNEDSNSSSNATGGISGGGVGGALDSALFDSLTEYQKAWDESFANMESKANGIADAISKPFIKLYEGISQVAGIAKEKLEPVFRLFSETILPDLKKGFQRLVDVMTPFGKFIEKTFASAWNDLLKPVLEYLGDKVIPILTKSLENLWNNVLVPIGNLIADILTPVIEFASDILTKLWQNVLVPLGQFVGSTLAAAFEGLAEIYNKVVIPAAEKIIEKMTYLWKNVFSPIVNFMIQTFSPVFDEVFKGIRSLIENATKVFTGLINFITGAFTGDWNRAWTGAKLAFSGFVGALKTIAKTPINAVMAMFEGLANGVIKAWNAVKRAINSLSLKVPDWVPGVGGKKIGFNLKMTSQISLPRFAMGGFPEDGTFRASHGEIMGRFDNGQSVVANNKQITDGISAAVYQGNRENNNLLREQIKQLERQNELLSAILAKEGLSKDVLFESVRQSEREYRRMTGTRVFV